MFVGQSVPRREDDRFLTGRGRFVDDVAARTSTPLYAAFVRSPHAHAAIDPIDSARAAAMPGVRAILTGADWAREGLGRLPCVAGIPFDDGRPMNQALRAGLAPGVARYVGDPVAVVIAESWAEAAVAAEAVAVDYRAMPAVVAPRAALAADAPLVHAEFATNLAFDKTVGDPAAVEAALARAAHVEALDLVNNRISANAIEPRSYLADHEAFAGRSTLWTASQTPHLVRRWIAAHSLGIPEHTFRVVAPDVGGGFGMKSHYPEEPVLVWAARKLAASIRWTATRSESLMSDSHARDHATVARLGFDAAGCIVALDVRTVGSIGAYATTFGPLILGAAYVNLLSGLYAIPLIHARIQGVYTHTVPIGPYRGAGRPEASYMIERLIDIAADELKIDPAELRRRNTIPPSAMPYKTPLTFTYDSGRFEENMDRTMALAEWRGFEARRTEAAKRGMLRGIGISNTIEQASDPTIETAEIRFDPLGGMTFVSGSISHGQGHATIQTQMLVDRLGVEPDRIKFIQGDTDSVAFGMGTGGSRSTTMSGGAIVMVSEKIVLKAKKLAAHLLEAAETDMEFKDGRFTIAGTDRGIGIHDVAKTAFQLEKLPPGMEPGLYETATYRARTGNFPNGCHVCEVEIDPETGATKVIGYWVVDDVGTVINPMLVKGQIMGGIAQGMGQVLMEDKAYEPQTGQVLSGSFMDYAMPRADDFCDVAIEDNPVPTPTNPLGVKGAGEAGTVGSLSAGVNAIVDALSVYGIRHIDTPCTPYRVWQAIKNAKQNVGATS